jgi:hypothetical protein
VPVAVVAAGGARVGVAQGVLDVFEGGAGLAGGGGEGVAQRVWADPVGVRQPGVAVEAAAGVGDDQRPVQLLDAHAGRGRADGEVAVQGAGGAGVEGAAVYPAAFAGEGQGAVVEVVAEVLDVEPAHLADPQAEVGEQGDHGAVAGVGAGAGQLDRGEQRVDLADGGPDGGGEVAVHGGPVGAVDGLRGVTSRHTRKAYQEETAHSRRATVAGEWARRPGSPSVFSSCRAYPVSDVRRGDLHRHHQALGVHDQMPLPSVDQLGAVEPAGVAPDRLGGLHRLRVDARGDRAWAPATTGSR